MKKEVNFELFLDKLSAIVLEVLPNNNSDKQDETKEKPVKEIGVA